MKVIQLKGIVGTDCTLRLAVPGVPEGEYEVVIVLHQVPSVPRDERGWPIGYFEQTAGSITDPAFKRYPL